MIKKIYTVTMFLTISYFGFAQTRNSTQDTIKKYKEFNIVKIGDQPPIVTRYLFLDPRKLSGLSSLSNESNAELSKLLNVDYILVTKLNPDAKLLTLNEVLKLYKISTIDWNLPLMVDDERIDYPQTILIAQNQIEKVVVVKDTTGAYIQITRIK